MCKSVQEQLANATATSPSENNNPEMLDVEKQQHEKPRRGRYAGIKDSNAKMRTCG